MAVFERRGKSPFAEAIVSALDEARRRGDSRVSTEHLLLGLLHDPESAPARALGVGLEAAREALDDLDREALVAIGIDLEGFKPSEPAPSRKRPPLTSAARAALGRSVDEAERRRDISPRHLLHALLACERPEPVAELMAKLDIDRAMVRARMERYGS